MVWDRQICGGEYRFVGLPSHKDAQIHFSSKHHISQNNISKDVAQSLRSNYYCQICFEKLFFITEHINCPKTSILSLNTDIYFNTQIGFVYIVVKSSNF